MYFNFRKISTQLELLIISIIILTSCSITPQVTFEKYTPADKKLNSRVALIISNDLKDKIHESILYANCGYFHVYPGGYREFKYVKNGIMRARNTVGKAVEELFVKGLPYLFDKVDIYRSITEIRNKIDYDYILVAEVIVSTFYDKQSALERKVWVEDLLPFIKFSHPSGGPKIIKSTPFQIGSSVEYQLKVINAKSDTVITTFTAKNLPILNGETSEAYCSGSDPKFYNLNLSEAYKNSLGEAMSKAFEELLKITERGLIPSDLSINAYFSDKGSLLPNNVLDADEEAEIVITAKNNGKGIGYGTYLEILSDNPKISVRDIKVGNIPPGETKDIRVNLRAGKNLEDGNAIFKLNLKEKRGYDAKEVALNVPTSNQINRVIDSIIAKVRYRMSQKGWKRIAIAEIESHHGYSFKLEQHLLLEFHTRFENMKEVSVVEKPLLNKALTALKTNFSDLVRPASEKVLVNHDSVKKLGDLTGADAIFMVTLKDMKDSVRINSSLVDIERGKVYTIAIEDIEKRRPF